MKNYTFISCLESKVLNATHFYSRFKIGTFPPGQGLTIANTLRRSLLSQIPGVAITLVKIENVLHEYENIPGSQECGLDLLFNLKQVILSSDFEAFTPQIAFLTVKGPGIVRAGDLKLPFFITCVNPDQYIATLTEKGELNMSLLVNSGKNYLQQKLYSSSYYTRVKLLQQWKKKYQLADYPDVAYSNWQKQNGRLPNQNPLRMTPFLKEKLDIQPKPTAFPSQQNKKSEAQSGRPNPQNKKTQAATKQQQQPLLLQSQKAQSLLKEVNYEGYLPIDAVFSPVTKANYTVHKEEGNKKGESLFFEIWTNGSMDPRYAIHRAVKAIFKLFFPLQLKNQSLIPQVHKQPLLKTIPAPVSPIATVSPALPVSVPVPPTRFRE